MGDGPGYDHMYARMESEAKERHLERQKLLQGLIELNSRFPFQYMRDHRYPIDNMVLDRLTDAMNLLEVQVAKDHHIQLNASLNQQIVEMVKHQQTTLVIPADQLKDFDMEGTTGRTLKDTRRKFKLDSDPKKTRLEQ